MKKYYLKNLIILIILALFLVPVLRLKADSGWDSDYDSGWDSDSSEDSDSSWDFDSPWDSNSDSDSESGEYHGLPVEIIIIGIGCTACGIIAIILLITDKKKKKKLR